MATYSTFTIQPQYIYCDTTVCNKSYCGQRTINAIHKGSQCMWNMIVVYVVLAYSVLSMKVLCDIAMASNAWRLKRVNYNV